MSRPSNRYFRIKVTTELMNVCRLAHNDIIFVNRDVPKPQPPTDSNVFREGFIIFKSFNLSYLCHHKIRKGLHTISTSFSLLLADTEKYNYYIIWLLSFLLGKYS